MLFKKHSLTQQNRGLTNKFLASKVSTFASLPLIITLTFSAAIAQETFPAETASSFDAVEMSNEPITTKNNAWSSNRNLASSESETGNDEIADRLNSLQQLQQKVTLTRTIDGEIVETIQETIIYTDEDPIRSSEAGTSLIEKLNQRFDLAALTRNEAFEEAKLDFIVADTNRDETMSADEFEALVAQWRSDDADKSSVNDNLDTSSTNENDVSTVPGAPLLPTPARQKFAFMSGMSEAISQKDYIREYLTEFDAFDENNDSYLRDEELTSFRKASRGDRL